MSAAMLRNGVLICIAAALAACKPAESEAAAPAATPVPPAASAPAPDAAPPAADADAAAQQLAAVGGLRVGAPFGNAPGDKAFESAGMREAMEGDCEYYDRGTLPEGMSMMVIADRIARFDVQGEGDPGVRAAAPPVPFGLWVGMSVAEAKQRLPAGVVVSPHAYVSPDGDYLTWTDKRANLALRLETLNGVVTSIYWGLPDAVKLIEGCA